MVYITELLIFIMQLMIPCQVLWNLNVNEKELGRQGHKDSEKKQKITSQMQRLPWNPNLWGV